MVAAARLNSVIDCPTLTSVTNRWGTAMKTVSLCCRVCGRYFPASRFDALTCSSTCRQRLRRGQDLAYLNGLPERQQQVEREMHAANDRLIAAHRNAVAAKQKVRDLKREDRQRRAEKEQERAG